MARGTAVPFNRIERILAFMLGSIGGLTVVAIACVFIGGILHVDRTSGIWPVAYVLPLIGLPLALVFAIVLVIVMGVRRRRLAADDARK